MKNGTQELRDKAIKGNHPGFNYPLTFAPLQEKHTDLMMAAIWKSHLKPR